MSDKTIFEKIRDGEVPAEKLYEDEHCFVIADIRPKAPVHQLIIPKKKIAKLQEASAEDQALLGHLLMVAKQQAESNACQDFRLQINNGEKAGQTVFQLHLHMMGWPS